MTPRAENPYAKGILRARAFSACGAARDLRNMESGTQRRLQQRRAPDRTLSNQETG